MDDDSEPTFPRALTAINGQTRWQATNGRTYETEEEARRYCEAREEKVTSAVGSPDLETGQTWISMLFGIGLSVAALFWLYRTMTDPLVSVAWWAWIVIAVVGFVLIGWGIECVVGLHARLNGLPDRIEREQNASKVWGQFGSFIFKATLIVVAGIAALVFVYWVTSSIFDGVSKGTAMIVVLLFLILMALTKIASRDR